MRSGRLPFMGNAIGGRWVAGSGGAELGGQGVFSRRKVTAVRFAALSFGN
jgi:hypothetical protein